MLNQKGMGLAEVMVAVGITSISMMGIISSQKMMATGQRGNVQNEEADNLALNISNLLSDNATCNNNFGPTSAAPGAIVLSATNLTRDIVDFAFVVRVDTNPPATAIPGKIALRSYRFLDMGIIGPGGPPGSTMHAGRLLLNIERQVEGYGGAIARNITMRATVNGAGRIIDCHSMGINRSPWAIDGNNIYNINPGNVGIGTPNPAYGFHSALQSFFSDSVGVGTAPTPGTALSIGGNTQINGNVNQIGNYTLSGLLTAGSITTPNLAVTNLTVAGTTALNGPTTATTITATGPVTAPQFCIGANCRTTFAAQACPPGQVVITQNVDGTVVCQTPGSLIGNTADCPIGYYLAGLDPSGGPECRVLPTGTCPVGNYIDTISPSGTITCKPIPPEVQVANCPAGQHLIGVSGGVPQCSVDAQSGFSCPPNQAIGSFSPTGTPNCVATAPASVGCAPGQAMQGFDGAGNPICLTSGSGSTSMMSMATINSRTTGPVDGVVGLNTGDAPATADAYIINFVIGTMGGGSRSDRNCFITSTSGSYLPVWMGNDSKGDGGQKGVAGSVMVPTDGCGSLVLNCRNNGSAGAIRIVGVVDDGAPNMCTRVWAPQACGYVYPIGDPCVFMPACTTETPGASCSTTGAACSRGVDQLVCVRS